MLWRLAVLALVVLPLCYAQAAGPRVLPDGQLPDDARLGPLKGEAGDFNLTPAKSPEDWKKRSEEIRRIMLVALGLWPMPTKNPLNAVIHGKLDFDEYTVEKVYFESVPGFYVSGSLYRPKGKEGKRPAVLSPHGHFPGGRFQDNGDKPVRWQVARGEERFEDGGRSVMQSRHVQLARMGCVVFHYDMVSYADAQQLPIELVHQFSRHRVKHAQPPESGFYSAAAEGRLQNIMGLHTLNSIRALDFLLSLPDVDPKRVAVTGASGGGTQTFMLCAVDDRPLVSVPVVIVSSTRQGGCTCENIPLLRIGTHNLDFTALHAPKPLLCISADDATRTLKERGFPELQQHYLTLGGKGNVAHEALLHFPHNYNYVSRSAMYHFVNKHLGIGLEEPILEKPYQRLTEKELTVFDDKHPRPAGGPEAERKLLRWLSDDADKQLAALTPAEYRRVVGGAVDVMVRQKPMDVEWIEKKTSKQGSNTLALGLLRYRSVEGHQVELPACVVAPANFAPRSVVWLDQAGKAGLFADDGTFRPEVSSLLEAGVTVISADLLYQGESLAEGKPITRTRSLKGEEAFVGWTSCYNLPLVSQRAGDVLALAGLAKKLGFKQVSLVAVNGSAPWATLALAQAPDTFGKAAVDTRGFRFAKLTDPFDVNFLPGSVKYGDVPGLLALAAPTQLSIAGEKEVPALVRSAYESANAQVQTDTDTRAQLQWLLKRK